MQISVSLLPDRNRIPSGSWAVVIDTLRFTTTACQALAAEAESITVASEIEEVRTLASQSTEPTLLCGERNCTPIEGFDLGNSPWEYQSDVVRAQRLYFTTTNGTRAIAACNQASRVLLAALVNRSVLCERLKQWDPKSVEIVCAGTDGLIALEDALAAGAIVERLFEIRQPNLVGDESQLVWQLWKSVVGHRTGGEAKRRIEESFQNAAGGINLMETGFHRDLEFAADLDSLDVVPTSSQSTWSRFSDRTN